MDDLLDHVLESHGGLDRWNEVDAIQARLRVDGPFWDWRGFPQIRQPQTLTVQAHRQRLTLAPFTRSAAQAEHGGSERGGSERGGSERGGSERGGSERGGSGAGGEAVFETDGVAIGLARPARPTFPKYQDDVRWTEAQLLWFMGTANWGYFTEPFLFTYPGVRAHEIEPWREGDETWRRLFVTFPDELPNHNTDQVFYYGDDLLLRRMDYAPDVTGNGPIAHYVHDPIHVDGLVFYGRRSVHLRGPDGVADQSWAPITITTDHVTLL